MGNLLFWMMFAPGMVWVLVVLISTRMTPAEISSINESE